MQTRPIARQYRLLALLALIPVALILALVGACGIGAMTYRPTAPRKAPRPAASPTPTPAQAPTPTPAAIPAQAPA